MCFSPVKPKESSPAMPENEQKTPIDPDALAAAREQAEDLDSFLRPFEIPTKDGGVYKLTHPRMLDDDGSEEYEQMLWEFNQCDRYTEDVPETTLTTPDGGSITTKSHTMTGGFIEPRQKDGVRKSPSQAIRTLKILCGSEDEYQKAKAAGVTGNALARAMMARAQEERERLAGDSKSDGGAVVPEEVAEAD